MAEARFLEEFVLALAQFQPDRGAPGVTVAFPDGKLPRAVGYPAPGLILAGAPTDNLDLARNHKGRIESDTELTDGVQIRFIVLAVFLQIGRRARPRDGTEVRDQRVAVHADAIVLNGEGSGVLIEGQANAQITVFAEPLGVAQGLEAELIHRIRGVRDQFS